MKEGGRDVRQNPIGVAFVSRDGLCGNWPVCPVGAGIIFSEHFSTLTSRGSSGPGRGFKIVLLTSEQPPNVFEYRVESSGLNPAEITG